MLAQKQKDMSNRPITYNQKSRQGPKNNVIGRRVNTQVDVSNITLEEYLRSQLEPTLKSPTHNNRIKTHQSNTHLKQINTQLSSITPSNTVKPK
jgi:hypothetical protein